MVQKPHSQPPGMKIKPVVNNGIFNYHQPQLVNAGFLNHQQYAHFHHPCRHIFRSMPHHSHNPNTMNRRWPSTNKIHLRLDVKPLKPQMFKKGAHRKSVAPSWVDDRSEHFETNVFGNDPNVSDTSSRNKTQKKKVTLIRSDPKYSKRPNLEVSHYTAISKKLGL